MKTIFITSFQALVSRNILQTDLLKLLSKDNRVVILVPDLKRGYFIETFSGENIVFEGIDAKPTKRDLLMRRIALSLANTKTIKIKKRSEFFDHKKRIVYLAYIIPGILLGRFHFLLKLFRGIDYVFSGQRRFKNLFDKYKPDLIFATDIQNELDVRLIQESKKVKIKTLAMVRSWDNLTSKGVLRVFPDKLVVNNDIVKNEAIKINGFLSEKISVIGIPHYDKYGRRPNGQKEEFFRNSDFDINKKLILVAPAGNRYIRNNKTDKFIVEALSELDLNILVRVPPGDVSNFEGFKSKKAKVAFDYSGIHTWKGSRKTNEISKADDDRLRDSLYFSDVVVAHLATMCIDASFFNKPVVTIGFDPEKREYIDSIKKYFDYDHLQPLIKSKGLKIAHKKEELLDFVKKYLKNKDLDKEGRELIVKQEVKFKDSKSTERLYDVIT